MLLSMNKLNKPLKVQKSDKLKTNKSKLITKISIALNCVFIFGILAVVIAQVFFHVLDYAIASKGNEIMCNDNNFRKRIYTYLDDEERARALATMDYNCVKDNAREYYMDGLKKYLKSLGISIDQ